MNTIVTRLAAEPDPRHDRPTPVPDEPARLPQRKPSSSAPLSLLSDADAASVSDLSARRRASTSVADADAAYRAGLVEQYIAACASGADEFAQLAFLAEATRYDLAHPDDIVPLFDELHGTQLGAMGLGVAA